MMMLLLLGVEGILMKVLWGSVLLMTVTRGREGVGYLLVLLEMMMRKMLSDH